MNARDIPVLIAAIVLVMCGLFLIGLMWSVIL